MKSISDQLKDLKKHRPSANEKLIIEAARKTPGVSLYLSPMGTIATKIKKP